MQAAPAPKNCKGLKPPKDVLKVAGQPSRLAEPDDLQDEAEGREPQQFDGQEQRTGLGPSGWSGVNLRKLSPGACKKTTTRISLFFFVVIRSPKGGASSGESRLQQCRANEI